MVKGIQASVIFLFLYPATVAGQAGSMKIVAEIPLQFGVGYEGRLTKRFSLDLQAGVLTEPNSAIIVNVLEALGTDEEIILMIDETFKFGTVVRAGTNYNFGRNYFGAFAEVIALRAASTPAGLIETYFDEDLSSYPDRRGRKTSNTIDLQLSSTLLQGGILYGRRFPLRNIRMEIVCELGVSANLSASSKLRSEGRDLSKLSTEVDEALDAQYKSFAFIPRLGLALVYKFVAKE